MPSAEPWRRCAERRVEGQGVGKSRKDPTTYAILRIWLCVKTTKTFVKSRVCGMRHVEITWRVFYSTVFYKALGRASRRTSMRGHATFISCAKWFGPHGNRRGGERRRARMSERRARTDGGCTPEPLLLHTRLFAVGGEAARAAGRGMLFAGSSMDL